MNDQFGLQPKTDEDSHPSVNLEVSERITLMCRVRHCDYNKDTGVLIVELWDRDELEGVFAESGHACERLKGRNLQ
jgi:hypothetical protein